MPKDPFVSTTGEPLTQYTNCEVTQGHDHHFMYTDPQGINWYCIGHSYEVKDGDITVPFKILANEVRTKSSTGGEKGVKDARFDLIPIGPLTQLATLYGRGAAKYDSHNWRKGYEWSKSYAAMQRHATQFWNGEDVDEEMDLPHLTAVIFHAMALLEFMEKHPNFDDRYKDV